MKRVDEEVYWETLEYLGYVQRRWTDDTEECERDERDEEEEEPHRTSEVGVTDTAPEVFDARVMVDGKDRTLHMLPLV